MQMMRLLPSLFQSLIQLRAGGLRTPRFCAPSLTYVGASAEAALRGRSDGDGDGGGRRRGRSDSKVNDAPSLSLLKVVDDLGGRGHVMVDGEEDKGGGCNGSGIEEPTK